jgi:hypothetical protein
MRDVCRFFGCLLLIVVGLKLAGRLTWSWLWVLSPVWLPVVLFSMVVTAVGFILARQPE